MTHRTISCWRASWDGGLTLRHPLINPVIFEDGFETGTTAAWSGGSK